MDALNERLQVVFMFQPTDLKANRGGRLSKRQQTLLASARSTSRLAILVFVLVMLGTVGVTAFSMFQSPGGTPQPSSATAQDNSLWVTLGIAMVAVVVVIVIGMGISRRYVAALSTKQISVAKGKAQVATNIENIWQVKVGATKLRLSTDWQLSAFQPGTEYRVYYLTGPVPNILSAEVLGADGAPIAQLDVVIESDERVAQGPIVQVSRSAGLIIVVLALLVLEIPFAAIWASSLPESLRWWVYLGLGVETLCFVGFALWRLSPHT